MMGTLACSMASTMASTMATIKIPVPSRNAGNRDKCGSVQPVRTKISEAW